MSCTCDTKFLYCLWSKIIKLDFFQRRTHGWTNSSNRHYRWFFFKYWLCPCDTHLYSNLKLFLSSSSIIHLLVTIFYLWLDVIFFLKIYEQPGKRSNGEPKNENHANRRLESLTKYASFTIIKFAITTISRGRMYMIRILDVQKWHTWNGS